MEYVDGSDLWQATRNVGHDEIVELLVQVLRALSYVHSRKVVHLDLKPANVLVDRAGRAKVLDFGLVGLGSDRWSEYFGTPAYMAPEIGRGHVPDHRADIYSLGIVAYRVLTGRFPFEAGSISELLRHHASTPIDFDADSPVSEPLRRVIRRMTAKDPGERYRTANAVIEALGSAERRYEIETGDTKESYLFSSRFVGREEELVSILRFIRTRAESASDEPPALLVRGDSGIGKSRLLREVRHHVQMSRAAFLEAHCYEGTASEFAPIAELLAQAKRLALACERTDLVDRFAPHLGDVPAARGNASTAEAERLQLLDRIGEFLIAVAELRPSVLCIHDLQWARPGTIDALAHLLRLVVESERADRRVSLSVLGSYRGDEVERRPLEALLDSARELGRLHEMEIVPLEREEVRLLVCSMLGIEDLPAEFIDRLSTETAGAPFFVEEVMRVLVENGSVFLRDGAWAAARTIRELEIPTSIRQVFLRRVGFLAEAPRSVLELISVSARPTPPEILEAVSALPADVFHAALTELVRKRMVSVDAGMYATTHDRMRESVYATLSSSRRKTIHERFGEAFERQGELDPLAFERCEHVYETARHYRAADQPEKALPYAVAGGRRAAASHATSQAIEFLSYALAQLRSKPGEEALVLSLTDELGDCEAVAGRYTSAKARYERVLAAASDPLTRAKLLNKIGSVWEREGNYERAFESLWEAAILLGARRPESTAEKLLSTAGLFGLHLAQRALPWRVTRTESERATTLVHTYQRLSVAYSHVDHSYLMLLALRGIRLGQGLGDRSLSHAMSCGGLGFFYGVLGRRRTSARYFERCHALLSELGASSLSWDFEYYRGITLCYQGEWREAEALCRGAMETYRAAGELYQLGGATYHACKAAFHQGAIDRAMRMLEDNLERVGRADGGIMRASLVSLRATLHSALGDLERAREDAEHALHFAQMRGDVQLHVITSVRLGNVHLWSGRVDDAIAVLEDGLRVRARTWQSPFYLPAEVLLARAYVTKAEREVSGRERKHALRRAAANARAALRISRIYPNHRPAAWISEGRVHAARGRTTRARESYERACELARRQGAGMYEAEARLELGELLAKSGQSAAARRLLHESRTQLASFGAHAYVERCERALRAL
jgi:predicted ATPase